MMRHKTQVRKTDPSREKERDCCKFGKDLEIDYTIKTVTIISYISKCKKKKKVNPAQVQVHLHLVSKTQMSTKKATR